MKRRLLQYIALLLIVLIGTYSCSTTKTIPEGEYRLVANKITVENPGDDYRNDLSSYIKQKPNTNFILGWNPFLNIYNWENGKGRCWDKFVHKMGQKPVQLDKSLIASSKENIINHLEYQGFYNSSVSDSIATKKKRATVFYNVTLGNRFTIDTITYKISNNEVRDYIIGDTANSIVKRGDILSQSLLEAESQRIASYMNNNGFYTFSKNHLFFEADTLKRREYASLEISANDYTRNESPSDAKLLGRYRFSDVYVTPTRRAYTDLRFMPERDSNAAKPDTNLFKSVYIVSAGKPLLRRSVINRMNVIKKGDFYSQSAVAQTYKRFSNLGVFTSVNLSLEEGDSSTVITNVRLTSAALQGYKVNLEMSSNSSGLLGVSPAISYFHKNLFRGGELFSLSFMGDFQFKFNNDVRSTEFGVSTSLSIPNFLLLPDNWFRSGNIPRTEIILSYNYQNRAEYTRNIISASYGYTWNTSNRLFFKISPIQLSIVKLFNMNPTFYESLKDPFLRNSYQDHFDLGLGANLYYTTNAAINPKSSYFYLRWQNDISGNFLSLFNSLLSKNSAGERMLWGSPYSQYIRSEISAVYTHRFGKSEKQSLAGRLLVGYGTGYGNAKSLPFEKLFWSGGAYSLRAWQARSVGPGNAQIDSTFSIPNQTGDIRLEANLEYRFPLFWTIEGAAFVDVGNVWTQSNSTSAEYEGTFKFNRFYKQLAADCGIGVRLNLGFALMRLDAGFKIHEPAEKCWFGPGSWFKKGNYGIQFGVGYPF